MKKPFTPITYMVALALMLAVMAALSACGDDVATPTTISTTITIPATATANTAKQFKLRFVTTGTIAGVNQTLLLDATDAASFDDGKKPATKGTITAKQNADLLAQIGKADFFNLKDKYDSGNVADDKYYTITVVQGGQTKSVTVAEEGGKGLTPQALLDLVTMLNSIQSGM